MQSLTVPVLAAPFQNILGISGRGIYRIENLGNLATINDHGQTLEQAHIISFEIRHRHGFLEAVISIRQQGKWQMKALGCFFLIRGRLT